MRICPAVALLTLLAACKDSTAPDPPTPLRDKIVFVSDRDGPTEVYVMPRTGGAATRLTFLRGIVDGPRVSPDGRKIAFTCPPGICVVDADGLHLTRVTSDGGYPAWSPDGKRIAFESGRDGNREIYAMNADGSALVRLTANPAQDRSPDWGADGRIAFESDRDGPIGRAFQVYVMNADGSTQHNLSNSTSSDYCPVWSHNTLMIAFGSDRSYPNHTLIMDANGGGQRSLTAFASLCPAWSPDDRDLVVSDISGPMPAFGLIDADGSNYRPLTDGLAQDREPSFSP